MVSRKSEAAQKKRDPKKKAHRWVVEACHGWFNRFRKLLVRYEKLEHTFLAINHLATAIIVLRKIELPVNIIYGSILSVVSAGPVSPLGGTRCTQEVASRWRLM